MYYGRYRTNFFVPWEKVGQNCYRKDFDRLKACDVQYSDVLVSTWPLRAMGPEVRPPDEPKRPAAAGWRPELAGERGPARTLFTCYLLASSDAPQIRLRW